VHHTTLNLTCRTISVILLFDGGKAGPSIFVRYQLAEKFLIKLYNQSGIEQKHGKKE